MKLMHNVVLFGWALALAVGGGALLIGSAAPGVEASNASTYDTGWG